jgi:hypothetical protein
VAGGRRDVLVRLCGSVREEKRRFFALLLAVVRKRSAFL